MGLLDDVLSSYIDGPQISGRRGRKVLARGERAPATITGILVTRTQIGEHSSDTNDFAFAYALDVRAPAGPFPGRRPPAARLPPVARARRRRGRRRDRRRRGDHRLGADPRRVGAPAGHHEPPQLEGVRRAARGGRHRPPRQAGPRGGRRGDRRGPRCCARSGWRARRRGSSTSSSGTRTAAWSRCAAAGCTCPTTRAGGSRPASSCGRGSTGRAASASTGSGSPTSPCGRSRCLRGAASRSPRSATSTRWRSPSASRARWAPSSPTSRPRPPSRPRSAPSTARPSTAGWSSRRRWRSRASAARSATPGSPPASPR